MNRDRKKQNEDELARQAGDLGHQDRPMDKDHDQLVVDDETEKLKKVPAKKSEAV
jgi:hypothetical protein